MLSEKVACDGWGAKTIERLSKDIIGAFPDISGFSFRNRKYMRQFAESYPDDNWAAAAAQIPWSHNMLILDKVEGRVQRLWYAKKAIENGWSRAIVNQGSSQ